MVIVNSTVIKWIKQVYLVASTHTGMFSGGQIKVVFLVWRQIVKRQMLWLQNFEKHIGQGKEGGGQIRGLILRTSIMDGSS